MLGVVTLVLLGSPRATPAASCPADMVLVEGEHPEQVQHMCSATKWGYCSAFEADRYVTAGPTVHVRACMDRYEAPNLWGIRPFVMKSAVEGEYWCQARGKRLCSEYEWETACEGPERRPYGYGWVVNGSCNMEKPWRPFDATVLMGGGQAAEVETERLWQGEGAGARPTCVGQSGVHDMVGNAEEWVRASRRHYRWSHVLMGGHWAKPWQTCRGTNWAHEPTFRFYEVGFRCCADPR